MDKKSIAFINELVYRRFLNFMDSEDAYLITESIIEDVIQDVAECADAEGWHSGDVEIAVTRVLKKRLGIE